MKLGIATICPHVFYDDLWWSYEPFVLEMNVWADLFEELIFVAPLEQGPPPPFWVPYQKSKMVSVIPYRQNKGRGLRQARTSVMEIPMMFKALIRAIKKTDAFHVRLPGSIGLFALLIPPFFYKQVCAKYAGQWNNYFGEPWSFRLQKTILRSRWWKGPVTVYGQWPNQPSHIIPFFTSVMTGEQMGRAQAAARHKRLEYPLRVLYVGRLSADKNVDVLLSAIAKLKAEGSQIQTHIVGDGPQRMILERQANELALQQTVNFIGAVDFEHVLDFYEQAHVSVLVSNSEGWPKAIAEAMAFGLVCIGSDRGLVPWMLGEGRGLVVPPGDVEALANALRQLATEPEAYQMISKRAATWAQQYSLEGLREALRELLSKEWGEWKNCGLRISDGGMEEL